MRSAFLAAGVAVLVLPSLPVYSAPKLIPAGAFRQNFDARYQETSASASVRSRMASKKARAAAVKADAQQGVRAFKQAHPTARVTPHEILGSPKMVGSGTELLAPPSSDSPEKVVRSFVSDNSRMFGLSAGSFDEEVKTVASYKNPKNQASWVTLQQEVGGIKVFQGELRAAVNQQGALVAMTSDFAAGLDASMVNVTPGLSADEAALRAAEELGFDVRPVDLVRKPQLKAAIDYEKTAVTELINCEQVVFPLEAGNAILAWQIIIVGDKGAYIIVLSADDGSVLFRKNAKSHQTQTATFEFYPGESPVVALPWPYLPMAHPEDVPAQAFREVKTLTSEAPQYNLFGWIGYGDNLTQGNNVLAGRDQFPNDGIDADLFNPGRNSMAYGHNDGPSADGRNFTYPGWTPPPYGDDEPLGEFPTIANEPYDSGSVTNMFFWSNRYHDRMYELGFTESARNFQASNFGNDGKENDPIKAESQDWRFTNNATMMTLPDGFPGRMEMYVFTGSRYRDGALDQQVMLHELTHGLSNRLIGDAVGLNFQQGGGMGEGWSDFYSLALLSDYIADNNPDAWYPAGSYLSFNFIGQPAYFYGIRRFPYSTDMSVSPLTWADSTAPTYYSNDGIVPESPLCLGLSIAEVHNLGELWSSMLWEVRANIMKHYQQSGAPGGFKDGNQHALQLITDAMKLTPSNPRFTEARDAILQSALLNQNVPADFVSYDADNLTVAAIDELAIWEGFAKRGLGRSAYAPPANDSAVVELEPVNYYTVFKGLEFIEENNDDIGGVEIPVPLEADDFFELDIPGGNTFTFYGVTYNRVFVSSNGYLTFDTGSDSAAEDLEEHFEQPGIAALRSDLDPTTGTEDTGVTAFDQGDQLYILFRNVSEQGSPDIVNTFAFTLRYDTGDGADGFSVAYGEMGTKHGISGLSRGENVCMPCFVQSDLSEYDFCNPSLPEPDRFVELFDENPLTPNTPFDLEPLTQLRFEHLFTEGWLKQPQAATDIPLTATQPLVSDPFPGGNNNGTIEPGEEVQIRIPVRNDFMRATVNDVWGRLTTDLGNGVTILEPIIPYGRILPGQASAGFNESFAFKVRISPQVPCGAIFSTTLDVVTTQTGITNIVMSDTNNFRVSTGVGDPFTRTWNAPGSGGGQAVVKDPATLTASSISLTSAPGVLQNMVLRNTRSNEQVKVEAVFQSPLSITVTRGYNGSPRGAMLAGDLLTYVSVAIPDGNNGGITVELEHNDVATIGQAVVTINNFPHKRIGDLSVQLTGPTVEEIIIDNPAAFVSGPWTSETSPAAYNGGFLKIAKGTGANTVTYRPEIKYTGLYQVYVWNPASSSYSNSARFTVNHSSGSEMVPVNQRGNGGVWVSLGVFTFTAGTDGTVVVSDLYSDTASFVVADAVRFQYAGEEGGKTITLFDQLSHQTGNNVSANIVNLTLSDLNPLDIQNEAGSISNKSLHPMQSLDTFRGQPGQGKWKLRVTDRSAQNLGEIGSWSLTLRSLETPCPNVQPLYTSSLDTSVDGWVSLPSGDTALQSTTYKVGAPSTLVLHTKPGTGYRAPGWQSPGVNYEPFVNQAYRFNAWVARTGQPDINNQAMFPNLMLRAHIRYAQDNTAVYQFNPTQYDPSTNDIMRALSPSTDPTNPTKYSVDLDPVDVPALTDPAIQLVRGTVQSYCIWPEQQGNLEITETSIERWTMPEEDEGTVLRVYNPGDLVEGIATAYNLSNPDPLIPIPNRLPEISKNEAGVTIDTTMADGGAFSMLQYDLVPPDRIEPVLSPNKSYRVRYHVISNTPSDDNPRLNLRARAIRFNFTQMFGIGGAKSAGATNNLIAAQSLPGIGTQNPLHKPFETQGGYYDQWFDSPAQLPSDPALRRLRFGFDLLDGIPGGDSFQNSTAGRMTLDSIEVREFEKVAP